MNASARENKSSKEKTGIEGEKRRREEKATANTRKKIRRERVVHQKQNTAVIRKLWVFCIFTHAADFLFE